MFEEITAHLHVLYRRLPSETYLFVAELLDQLKDQITADGLLGEADSSQASEYVFTSPPSQSSLSSQLSGASLTFSHIQSSESATEVDQADL